MIYEYAFGLLLYYARKYICDCGIEFSTSKKEKVMKRQKIRKAIIFISFLLFPITIWYFSPYLIIQAAFEHILNGSFWVFVSMFVISTFAGRVWCGYLCPAGGMQECLFACNDKPVKGGIKNNIKFVIWAVWIIALITTYILGKNDFTIDFFYMTDHGISVSGIYNYVIYYGVLFILVLPALAGGKRGACHYICWMAPFMIIGSSIGRALHIPQLHLEADSGKCAGCKQCNKVCPMGLDVNGMVQENSNGKCTECIQCGACVDVCPKKAIRYRMTWK